MQSIILSLLKWWFLAFCDFIAFPKAPPLLHFKMQVIHIDDVLGGDVVVQTRTNDRGVEHGCEEKGQEGHQEEGCEEEGRQEEEVIDLGQLDLLRVP
ncbi:MAG: hypothetical protein NTX21_02550 [Alphaproteobacteria bacterium]|nr:hypothetical protein [Alphaproteobacteria bacterium]